MRGAREAGLTIFGNRFSLWIAFVLVHLWLGYENLHGPGFPFGDVTGPYKTWTDQVLVAHYWVGIDGPFVYPILAIFPMLASHLLGAANYGSTWLCMIMLLNAVGLAALSGWGARPRNLGAAWWWLLFLMVLGPIAVGRIDSVTIPFAIIGMLLLLKHPVAAAIVLTVATWIKVWPAALLAAIVIASKHRVTTVTWAAITSAAIIAIALTYGSGANIFSFITQQAGRGLQIEAPISTPWMWAALLRVPDTFVYFDEGILTYQVSGRGATTVSMLMTPVLAIAALGTSALGVLAYRRKTTVTELLPVLSLALVTCLIAFNKVGSPQFIMWLSVPVIFGIVTLGRGFRTPAILVLVIAALTQILYPINYYSYLTLNPLLVVVVTVRNIMLFVLFGWTIRALLRFVRPAGHPESPDDEQPSQVHSPTSWPLNDAEHDRLREHP